MNSKFYIIVMVLLVGLIAAHGEEDIARIWSDPNPLLKRIQMQIDGLEKDHKADLALAADLQTLAYAINQEIIAAESPDWATPSVERKAVIQKWADILTPETQRLVDLAYGEGYRNMESAKQSRSLLDFAPATPVFADQVRKYLRKGEGGADLLFEHRLLTDADKEALRQLRPAEDREYELENWAVGMSSFGMFDGLEIAKKALSKEPHGETPEEITSPYLRFLRMVNNLGPDAAVLLPEIEALIAHPAIITSGYQRNFEYARDVITGKEPRQGRYAINGSGPLSPWLKSRNFEKPESGASISKSLPEFKRLTKQKPRLTTSDEQFPSTTWWSVVAVLVVAALGVLWLLLKKRK
jgi:hypothetical protein